MNPTLTDYPRVADRVPPSGEGIAYVVHQQVTDAAASVVAARMRLPVDTGVSVALNIAGETFMSDLEYERKTCLELAHNARGRVLIAGLGLGMVLPPLFDDGDVTEIVVVEKVRDVIALIGPRYEHPKLRIVHGDIFDWRPAAGETFDTIYFDVWPLITPMNLVQMTYLHRAFSPFLADGGWMESWMRRHLLRRLREAAQADPWDAEMGGCGMAESKENPENARKMLGVLLGLKKGSLDNVRAIALYATTMESCGLDVLPTNTETSEEERHA